MRYTSQHTERYAGQAIFTSSLLELSECFSGAKLLDFGVLNEMFDNIICQENDDHDHRYVNHGSNEATYETREGY